MPKDKYQQIINNNTKLISSVKGYIFRLFKIEEIEFNKSPRKYIKELLKSIRYNNVKVKYLRLKRERIRNDIKDLEASFITGDSYDNERGGKNTGLIPNTTEIKYLKRQTLKEELCKLVIETLEIEKSLEDNNLLVQQFIELIPNEVYSTILKMTYIDCYSNVEIASMLNYSVDTIDNARWRGIRELNRIVKN